MADKNEFLEDNVEEKVEQEEEVAEEEAAKEKIKVGDDEYSEEELNTLVSLGKIGREAEEKYDTKLDKVWPEYTKTRQEIKTLKEEVAKKEEAVIESKLAEEKALSPEEQRIVARQEAKKLGLLLDDDFDERYAQRRAAERITEDTKEAVTGAAEKYGIKTTAEEVLRHMTKPESPKVPEKAIKDMFETQIDKWKEDQLSQRKGTGLVTEGASAAGGKEPEEPKITRDNIDKALSEALRGS